MRLDNLAVKAGQLARGLGHQVAQGGDADGVVAGVHNAGALAQLAQAVHLLSRITRSAGNESCARALDIGDNGVKSRDVREVDDHVGRRSALELGQIKADLGHDVKDGLSGGINDALGGSADE